jgi:hypothetical protein
MNKSLPIVLVLLLAVLAVVLFFTMPGSTDEAEAVELRVYSVPQAYHNDIRSTLRYALSGKRGDDSLLVGRVTSGPNDTLVVTAPPKIHKGIEAFLDELAGMESPAAPPSPISMTYWFIVGRPVDPAALADRSGRQYLTTGKQSLANLAPALTQIASVQGPTEFRLLEQIQITSIGHDRTEARGKMAMVEQQATRTEHDNIVGEIMLTFEGRNQMRTQVMLKPDQLLVLGQAGFDARQLEHFGRGQDIEDVTLYYVMTSNLKQ